MRMSRPLRAVAISMAAAFFVGACASVDVGGNPGPPAPAPDYRVGDRWVYHAETGYRTKVEWNETHEIVSIGPDGITVKVIVKGPTIDVERIEKWSAPGVVLQGAVYEAETDRFDPPLIRYKFPLTPGETWNQRVRDLDQEPGPYGPISRYVTVGGYEKITTPAGTFDAIGMRVIMELDDETFWRFPTQCNYLIWYAPAIGASVREHKSSHWRDKGGQDASGYHPGQYGGLELVSYTRGP
jgi:hypothetical protein